MGKQKVHYFIRGYYYAPESYRALKKLSDFGKEIPIPMTGDEQGTMALYCFSKGFQQAIDYVKQVERQRLRKNKRFITYGVWTIEDPKMYIYSLSFRCRSDVCIQERMKCKKTFEEYLRRTNGKVEHYTECSLDADYRPDIVKNIIGLLILTVL